MTRWSRTPARTRRTSAAAWSARPTAAPSRCYRAVNAEASPLRFRIDPEEQLELHNRIDDAGLELGAIYHSHTRTAPRPSQTDINFAKLWPGVLWIIVGLDGDQAEVRTWRIDDGKVSDAELVVE